MRFVVFASIHYPNAFSGVSPTDFPNYYFPGIRVWDGRPIYEGLPHDVAQAFGWEYPVYAADPPTTLVLLSPLSLLKYQTAWTLFALLSVGLMTLSAWLAARELRWPTWASASFAAISVTAAPSLFLLRRNHMESLLAMLVVLGWIALRNDRARLAAWHWGVAASLKLFPAAWIVGLMHRGGLRFACTAGAAVAAFSGISVMILGWNEFATFAHEIIPRSREWYGVSGNYSLISFGAALSVEPLGWCAAGALFLSLFVPRLWQGPIDVVFIRAIVVSLLVSPLSWINYLVLLIPVMALLFTGFDQRTLAERLALYAIGTVLWLGIDDFAEGAHMGALLLGFTPTFALCALLAWSFRHDFLKKQAVRTTPRL